MNTQRKALSLLASILLASCTPPPPPVRGELRDFVTGRILGNVNVHVPVLSGWGALGNKHLVAVTDQTGQFEFSLNALSFEKGTSLRWSLSDSRQAKSEPNTSRAAEQGGPIVDAAMDQVRISWPRGIEPPRRERFELGVVYAETGAANAFAAICKDHHRSPSEVEMRLSALVFFRGSEPSDWRYDTLRSLEIGTLPGKVIICATQEHVKVGKYTSGADAVRSEQTFTAIRLSDLKQFSMTVKIEPHSEVMRGWEGANTAWLASAEVRAWLLREVFK